MKLRAPPPQYVLPKCRNAECVKKFIRLARVRHLPHREELRLSRGDAGPCEGRQNRLAYSPLCPVIFDGDEPTARSGNLFGESLSVARVKHVLFLRTFRLAEILDGGSFCSALHRSN
jgi:hypothetical protein